jgi:hypothetical protein
MLPKVNIDCDSEDEDDCAQRERETEEKTHSFQHFHMFQRITTVSNPLRSPVLPNTQRDTLTTTVPNRLATPAMRGATSNSRNILTGWSRAASFSWSPSTYVAHEIGFFYQWHAKSTYSCDGANITKCVTIGQMYNKIIL